MRARTGFLITLAVLLAGPLARAGGIAFSDPAPRPAADLASVVQQPLETRVARLNSLAVLGSNPEFLSPREPRDAGNKSPYRLDSKSGFRLNVDGQRPRLEYRFDNNTIMRLRVSRDGVRVVGLWNF